jgi:cell division protein ZapA
MSEPVKVSILDREFMVAAPEGEQADLRESARQLDARMREIRDGGRVVGTDRIAIMAALNLTHELLEAQARAGDDTALAERLQAIDRRISDYLDAVDVPAELRRR